MSTEDSTFEKSITDVLECKWCKHVLEQPYTFEKCLHNYCKKCTEVIPRSICEGEGGCFCPTCKDFSREAEIKGNTFIEDLQILLSNDQAKENKFCDQCSKIDKPAMWKCHNCKIHLCKECKIIHLFIPMLKDHIVRKLSDKQHDKVIDELIFCTIHRSKAVEFYCNTCKIQICSLCISLQHNGHSVQTIDHALKHILPDIEATNSSIKNNILKIENQINAIIQKVQQVRNTFSACKMELNGRFQKVMRNLKNIKRQMDDEIAMQEGIALDMLENIRVNLEHQLSKAQSLYSLVTVTTAKTRHNRLLCELQSGLSDKAKNSASKPQKPIYLKIPTTGFCEEQNLEQKLNDLQNLVGTLVCYSPVSNLDTDGVIWTENEGMLDNFNYILTNKLQKIHSVDLGSWCNRISYIDNKLYVCLKNVDQINIYNTTSGNLLNTTSNEYGIIVVRKLNNGDFVAGGTDGLYITNQTLSDWFKLSDGCYSDVFVHDQQFTALQCGKQSKIEQYSFNKSHDSTTKVYWIKSSEQLIETTLDSQDDCNSTLLVDRDQHQIVCIKRNIFEYHNRKLLNNHETQWTPSLCSVDKTGQLLVGNYGAGLFYIANNISNIIKCSQHTVVDIAECCRIRDAVVSDGSVWILEENNTYQLVKYMDGV